MFAYCGNNPVNSSDPSGLVWQSFSDMLLVIMYEGGGGGFGGPGGGAGNTHFSYVGYDTSAEDPNNPFSLQLITLETSGPSLSVNDRELTLGAVEFAYCTAGWDYEWVEIHPFDIGCVDLGATISTSGLDIGGMLSLWSPSVAIVVFDHQITLAANIGAIGYSLKRTPGYFEWNSAWGVGHGVTVEYVGKEQ